MARTLIAFLPASGARGLTFALPDRNGWQMQADGDVRLKQGDEVIALAPGTDVVVKDVNLAIRKEADARRAALFAIEDEVAAPVEALHVAIGPMTEAGTRREAVICDDGLFREWIALLAESGLDEAPIYAETAFLPEGPVAVDLGDRTLVRDDTSAFAIDNDMPAEAVTALLPAGVPHLGADSLMKWAAGARNAINLRQGKYAKRGGADIDWRAFRLPALLGVAAAVAWAMITGLEVRALTSETADLNSAARQSYQQARPGEPVPANLLQAVASESGGPVRRVAFLDVSADLYAALGSVETAAIRTLRFDGSAGRLQAALTYGAYGDELKIKTALEQQGYRVTLGDTRRVNGNVIGDITLEGGA